MTEIFLFPCGSTRFHSARSACTSMNEPTFASLPLFIPCHRELLMVRMNEINFHVEYIFHLPLRAHSTQQLAHSLTDSREPKRITTIPLQLMFRKWNIYDTEKRKLHAQPLVFFLYICSSHARDAAKIWEKISTWNYSLDPVTWRKKKHETSTHLTKSFCIIFCLFLFSFSSPFFPVSFFCSLLSTEIWAKQWRPAFQRRQDQQPPSEYEYVYYSSTLHLVYSHIYVMHYDVRFEHPRTTQCCIRFLLFNSFQFINCQQHSIHCRWRYKYLNYI